MHMNACDGLSARVSVQDLIDKPKAGILASFSLSFNKLVPDRLNCIEICTLFIERFCSRPPCTCHYEALFRCIRIDQQAKNWQICIIPVIRYVKTAYYLLRDRDNTTGIEQGVTHDSIVQNVFCSNYRYSFATPSVEQDASSQAMHAIAYTISHCASENEVCFTFLIQCACPSRGLPLMLLLLVG